MRVSVTPTTYGFQRFPSCFSFLTGMLKMRQTPEKHSTSGASRGDVSNFPGKLFCRRGHTFYALRHTFETIAGESRDQVAVDAIMGHSREDMASVYRERIGDDRLRAVAEHVRQWVLEKSMEAASQSTS